MIGAPDGLPASPMPSGSFVPRGRRAMTIRFHKGDLPDDADFGNCVAIDTETLGLVPHRDRLCVIQLSRGDQRLERARLTCGNVADSHTPGNNTPETRLRSQMGYS